ncbi:tetratricopeptide repeat protein [Marinobacter sp. 71-i]|uniref:Tetratricopeptide repeat protein n=1 Tax=Marinobacter iranensis TaxID=2962607 RepID=A0ABT5Y6N8_9GAMM|nr:tetratricopeptide repeat protein [Marinobacter iranensis]MDF0749231.1 tetratricopeptide repeat protein [Marinobacter iranensis]
MALLLVVALVAGCASSPKTDPADMAEEEREAREAELTQDFSEAVALLRGGDTDNARDLFEQIHQADPERTGPLANLGIIAQQEGNIEEAEGYFRQVIERDPQHSSALTHLGVMAREQGEFEQAETLYRKALEADPSHMPAMLNLAILLDIYLGRLEEALSLYEQYQSEAEEPNPRLKDWIFDVRNRL